MSRTAYGSWTVSWLSHSISLFAFLFGTRFLATLSSQILKLIEAYNGGATNVFQTNVGVVTGVAIVWGSLSWFLYWIWWVSMLIGAALALDKVQDLIDDVKSLPTDVNAEQWRKFVESAHKLAGTHETLPKNKEGTFELLSNGWWKGLVAYIIVVISITIHEGFLYAHATGFERWYHGASTMWQLLIALVCLLPFAATCTRCDELMDTLNKRSLKHLAENDDRIYRLEIALERLNKGGGLGISIFGVVINKRKLARVGTIVLTVAPTLLTTLRHYVQIGEEVCGNVANSSNK